MKLRKNAKIAIGAGAALCLILIISLVSNNKSADGTNSGTGTSANTQETASGKTSDKEKKEGSEAEEKENEEKEKEEAESAAKDKDKENQDGSSGSGGSGGSGSQNSGSQNSQNPAEISVSFPFTVPNSSIVVEDMRSFDGQYVEDGSDEEVSGVAAVILTNNGDTPVEYVDVRLKSSSASYQFKASAIAPGATVVVQDANRTGYSSASSYKCESNVANIDAFDMSDEVTVEENGNSLKVTNVSGSDIPMVRIFYKLYTADDDLYVGGITYTCRLTDLAADETVNVTPSHYMEGFSKIMMVRTYDSAD